MMGTEHGKNIVLATPISDTLLGTCVPWWQQVKTVQYNYSLGLAIQLSLGLPIQLSYSLDLRIPTFPNESGEANLIDCESGKTMRK